MYQEIARLQQKARLDLGSDWAFFTRMVNFGFKLDQPLR
jgi:hypothetical protein